MMKCLVKIFIMMAALIAGVLALPMTGEEPQLRSVTVKTRANENRTVPVYYRVPRDYDVKRIAAYRILVIFGGCNTSGISRS